MARRKTKSRTRLNSDCRGKAPFNDPHIARKAAARIPGRTFYICRHCGKWHVGSVPPKSRDVPSHPKQHDSTPVDFDIPLTDAQTYRLIDTLEALLAG